MKTAVNLLAAITMSFGALGLSSVDNDKSETAVSVLDTNVSVNNSLIQEPEKPVVPPPPEPDPQVAPAPPAAEASPSDQSAPLGLALPAPMQAPMSFDCCPTCYVDPCCCPPPVVYDCCQTCCVDPCCCPPPPQQVVYCIVDCNGCSHEACITVPACCAGQQPQISWRRGILGRQIATLCWACCGHKAKVVITAFGKVRVR